MIEELSSGTPPRILLVHQNAGGCGLLRETLGRAGFELLDTPEGKTCGQVAAEDQPDLIVLDAVQAGVDTNGTCRQLKENPDTRDIPVIFISTGDQPQRALAGFQAGGVDFITIPLPAEELLMRIITHVRIHRLARELRLKNSLLEAEIGRRREVEAALQKADAELSIISEREAKRWGLAGFVGRSEAFQEIVGDIRRLQKFAATSVLITGESGTGKELIARAIHYGSEFVRGPFVPVNCGAIPPEIAESAIFGHCKGSFSGATADHKGYFEQAHRGTLFLDEIGDMPMGLQVKLLRVLEDGQLVPVGSTAPRQVNVRLLAGTNADLEAATALGRFRDDLYFRIARFTIQVPPLRDRKDDIPMLVAHFLRVFSAEMGVAHPAVHPSTLAALQAYDYPGNIRELKNLVERALIDSDGAVIQPRHLHFTRRSHAEDPAPAGAPSAGPGGRTPLAAAVRDLEARRDEIEHILTYVRERGSINNSECRQILSVDLQHACYLLRKALRAGLLVSQGTGRWTRYFVAGPTPAPSAVGE
ncbi:MAG TPA: sigma-54 dependent transcriptional regulator [Verrucomicrobiota bacterium]|nr:sigma-54 dependent transcriptional regulator [Verrucomicrobiota bacterium]